MAENGFQMQRYVKFVKNSFLRSEILIYVSINQNSIQIQIIFYRKKKVENEILDIQFVITSLDKKFSRVKKNIH